MKGSLISSFIAILLLVISFNLYSQQDLTPEQIYEKVNDAVVIVLAYDVNDKPINQGSGVVISNDGYIITNYHVMKNASKVNILHNDLLFENAELIGGDEESDILFIKIPKSDLSVIETPESDDVKIGQKIYAIGSPLGYENTISDGIVSGYRKFDKINLIQITASISPGSSGGAVVNSKGELIGISTYTIAEGQNINFAIPLKDILNTEMKPYVYNPTVTIENTVQKADTEKQIKTIPKNSKIYNPKAVEYFNKGEELILKANSQKNKKEEFSYLKQAVDYFTKAIKYDDSFIEAYYEIGELYGSPFSLNDIEKAKKFFNKVEKLIEDSMLEASYSKSNREMLVGIANFYQLQELEIKNNSLKAAELYKKALEEELPSVIPFYPNIKDDDIYFSIVTTYRQLANYLTISEENSLGYINAIEYFGLALEYYDKLYYKDDWLRKEILNDKKVIEKTSYNKWKVFIDYDYKSVIYRLGKPLIANDFLFIYHPKTLEKDKKGIIKVWIKEVNLKEINERGAGEYDYLKSLYEFDLKSKKFRILQQSTQYNSEFVTSENYPNAEWQFVAPETIAEIMVENLKLIIK